MGQKVLAGEPLLELAISQAVQVDRESGIVRGVRVLGLTSLNGRTYLPGAIAKAKGLYEGRKVNYDHTPNKERTVGDRAGWLQDVRVDTDGGLSADLHLLVSDPRAAKVLEAAEKRPELIGLSHDATGRTRRDGDRMFVEEILGVRSVDLVADPASVKSLFESRGQAMQMKTVREVLAAHKAEWLPLLEEEAAAGMGDVPVDVPEEPNGDDEVSAAFKSMVNSVLDDAGLDLQAKLAKIREILKAQEKLTAVDEKPKREEPKEEKETESLKAELKALGDQVKQLTEAVAKLRRKPGTLPLSEVKGGGAQEQPPKDTDEFVRRILR